MIGAAKGDALSIVKFACGHAHFGRHFFAALLVHVEHQCDRAGPEFLHHPPGKIVGWAEIALGLVAMGEVNGQWLGGSLRRKSAKMEQSFGLIEHGGGAVDGFGGEHDDAAVLQSLRGSMNLFIVVPDVENLNNFSAHR